MKSCYIKVIFLLIILIRNSESDAQNKSQLAHQYLEQVKSTYAEMKFVDLRITYTQVYHYNSPGSDIEMTSTMRMYKSGNIYLSLFENGRLDYEFKQVKDEPQGIFRRGNDEFPESFLNATYRLHGVGRSSFSDISYLFYPDMRDSLVYQIWTGDFDLLVDNIFYENDTLIRISFNEVKIRTPEDIEEMKRHSDSIARKYFPIDEIPERKYAKRLEYQYRYYFDVKNNLLVKKETDYNDDIGVSSSEEWTYNYTFN